MLVIVPLEISFEFDLILKHQIPSVSIQIFFMIDLFLSFLKMIYKNEKSIYLTDKIIFSIFKNIPNLITIIYIYIEANKLIEIDDLRLKFLKALFVLRIFEFYSLIWKYVKRNIIIYLHLILNFFFLAHYFACILYFTETVKMKYALENFRFISNIMDEESSMLKYLFFLNKSFKIIIPYGIKESFSQTDLIVSLILFIIALFFNIYNIPLIFISAQKRFTSFKLSEKITEFDSLFKNSVWENRVNDKNKIEKFYGLYLNSRSKINGLDHDFIKDTSIIHDISTSLAKTMITPLIISKIPFFYKNFSHISLSKLDREHYEIKSYAKNENIEIVTLIL